MFMTAADYRESLRAYKPRVFLNGAAVESVADEPLLAPGINAVGITYDFAHRPEHAVLMTARQGTSGKTVNRMLHIDETSTDLLYKLEAVRLVCQVSGCAQRYLSHDGLVAIFQATRRTDEEHGTDYHQRFLAYLHKVQDEDLTLGVAMTDAKGDRSKRPGLQDNPDVYVHITERRADGIVIRGTKAIVTGAPYMHEFLVMPCRTHTKEDVDFAVCCAVPVDAPGVTIITRPAGRPGEAAAKFSAKYGQATGVVVFEDVFVPHDRVFLAGEYEEGGYLTTSYATHHRQTCIGARAGFGDLLIGAGALMTEANGLDPDRHSHIRDAMVELITITEGFFACGVAASVYCLKDASGAVMPDAVFANIGKLLLATKIYDMHKLAHYVSGGLIVALPGPDEDHNPETQASLSAVLAGRPDIPAQQRLEVSRLIEDLTASHQGGWYSVISLHGGGSPEAMKREIWRNYPVMERVELVERLLDRGVLDVGERVSKQPGRCCVTGCEVADARRRGLLGGFHRHETVGRRRLDEGGDHVGRLGADPRLDALDRVLHLIGAQIGEVQLDHGDDLLRSQMDGPQAGDAAHGRIVLDDPADRTGDFRRGGLADQQALALAGQEDRRCRKQKADADRGDAVERGHGEILRRRNTGCRDDDTDQRGAVLQKHDEGRRVLAAYERVPETGFPLDLAEIAEGDKPARPFEHKGEAEHDVVDRRIGAGIGRDHMLDALIEGEPGAERKDQHGDDEAPEIQFAPMAEGMLAVRRLLRPVLAVKQEQFVAGVDEGMEALAEHRRAAGKQRGGEFGDGDEEIADEGGVDGGAGGGKVHEISPRSATACVTKPADSVRCPMTRLNVCVIRQMRTADESSSAGLESAPSERDHLRRKQCQPDANADCARVASCFR